VLPLLGLVQALEFHLRLLVRRAMPKPFPTLELDKADDHVIVKAQVALVCRMLDTCLETLHHVIASDLP
jgi:hypothetical protein